MIELPVLIENIIEIVNVAIETDIREYFVKNNSTSRTVITFVRPWE